MGTRLALQLLSAALGVLLLWFGGSWVLGRWNELQSLRAAQVEQAEVDQANQATTADLGEAFEERAEREHVVASQRARADRQFEELRDENVDVGRWAADRIPLELREQDRASRGGRADADAGAGDPGADGDP